MYTQYLRIFTIVNVLLLYFVYSIIIAILVISADYVNIIKLNKHGNIYKTNHIFKVYLDTFVLL